MDRRELCSQHLVRHGRASERQNDSRQVLWVSGRIKRDLKRGNEVAR